jgi:hypothetical protein
MGTLIVLLGMVVVSGFSLYLVLGKLGLFKKVGDTVLDVKREIEEKNETPEENTSKNKGRDV